MGMEGGARRQSCESEGGQAQQRAARLSEWPASIYTLTRSLNGRCLLRFATPKDGPARSEIGGAAREPDVVALDRNGLSQTIHKPARGDAPPIAPRPEQLDP